MAEDSAMKRYEHYVRLAAADAPDTGKKQA